MTTEMRAEASGRHRLGGPFEHRPEPQRRQREADPPEGAGEGPDLGEADEDRRDPHRHRAADQRDESDRRGVEGWASRGAGATIRTFVRLAGGRRSSYHAPAVLREPLRVSPGVEIVKKGPIDRTASALPSPSSDSFEALDGDVDGGLLILVDHASNFIPPEYQSLGLPEAELERHIAYDIGAGALGRAARRAVSRAGDPHPLLAPPHRPEPRRGRSRP